MSLFLERNFRWIPNSTTWAIGHSTTLIFSIRPLFLAHLVFIIHYVHGDRRVQHIVDFLQSLLLLVQVHIFIGLWIHMPIVHLFRWWRRARSGALWTVTLC